jgi:large subunit ribosomal protein L35
MPKMKSHSGAKKRFSVTANGKVRFKRAKKRHILEKRSKSMKRKARKSGILCAADAPHIKALLPYA